LTCAPTGIPFEELRGVTVPVASTVLTISVLVIGVVLYLARFSSLLAKKLFLPQPEIKATEIDKIYSDLFILIYFIRKKKTYQYLNSDYLSLWYDFF
jgi:hypothetical protein